MYVYLFLYVIEKSRSAENIFGNISNSNYTSNFIVHFGVHKVRRHSFLNVMFVYFLTIMLRVFLDNEFNLVKLNSNFNFFLCWGYK